MWAEDDYLRNWILPRWGDVRLEQVKPFAMEEWLDSIERAKATRAKIRNLMSALFQHAMRYEWVDRNPIKLVRQSAKRERVPDVLELSELQLLLSRLELRERTLVLLDAATGLRVSELLALRWEDVDFKTLELRVTRSIWHQVIGECKTEASAKPVPLDGYMAEDLLRWKRTSSYPMMSDWVFASPHARGKQPYWPDNLMKRYIRPAARKAGIHKNIGWHTFRHTFGTLLKDNGEDVKTVQELLRHANSRITLDVYTQALNSTKRAAQSKVVRMMLPDLGTKEVGGNIPDPEITVKSVCGTCNNGWMSDLEAANIPIIGSMLNDLSVTLDREQQEKVAAWCVKTAIVLDSTRPKGAGDRFYLKDECVKMRESLMIPPKTRVWIGRIESKHLLALGTDTRYSRNDGQGPHTLSSVATLVVGHFVAQVITQRRLPKFADVDIPETQPKGENWQTHLTQIWAIQRDWITWPPKDSFTNGGPDGIAYLMDRWRLGDAVDPSTFAATQP